MIASERLAAQYIRMSTDKQDLSPSTQKEAIAAYAAARGLEVVASYEDEGRSGVHLKNRPGLLRLLHDVTQPKQFSWVLVYDVSRWGRFQDTDAAAYHEYHCRLHGVAVVYVAEMFGPDVNPITAMLKSMKRAMAAEYSRELASKCRAGQHNAVLRGYQMGPLPPLGFRRCSVSSDGQQRVQLRDGQRKVNATDRIEWVAASQEEVALVRRICEMFASTRLSFSDIARIGVAEGWRDHQGRVLTKRSVGTLIRNEALIGNFIWGRKKHAKSMVSSDPSRKEGCIPRLIDGDTWDRIQGRFAQEAARRQTNSEILANLRRAFQRSPLLVSRDSRVLGLPGERTVRARLGSWADCAMQAGQDPAQLRTRIMERARQRREQAREFGIALAWKLRDAGHAVTFDGKLSVLDFGEVRIRVRLLWPTLGEEGHAWRMRIESISRNVDFDLVVRMEDSRRPKDFFVAPPADVVVRFPHWLATQIPGELSSFWCRSPDQLMMRIQTLTERSAAQAH